MDGGASFKPSHRQTALAASTTFDLSIASITGGTPSSIKSLRSQFIELTVPDASLSPASEDEDEEEDSSLSLPFLAAPGSAPARVSDTEGTNRLVAPVRTMGTREVRCRLWMYA